MPELHWSMLLAAAGTIGLLVSIVLVIRNGLSGTGTTHETPHQKRVRRSQVFVLPPLSLLLLVVAGVMYVFVRPVEVSSAERDETIRVFLDAVRRDDGAMLRSVVATGFEPDGPFLREHVHSSEQFEQGSSYISSGDDLSCVRGMLFPKRSKIILKLIKEDRWRVLRAGSSDPCEAKMRF